tara:strand:- start:291 stop:740 length:450 start_codon:yes stop_codon:yes gene_type:complete
MKLTKENLKRIIAEELEGVLEAYMGPEGPRGRGGYKPSGQQAPMAPDLAFKLLSFGWNELEEDQKERIKALAKIEAEVGRPELSNAVAKAKGSEVEEGMLGKVRDAIMGPETPEDKKDAKFRQQRMNTRKVQAPPQSMKLRGPFEEDKK